MRVVDLFETSAEETWPTEVDSIRSIAYRLKIVRQFQQDVLEKAGFSVFFGKTNANEKHIVTSPKDKKGFIHVWIEGNVYEHRDSPQARATAQIVEASVKRWLRFNKVKREAIKSFNSKMSERQQKYKQTRAQLPPKLKLINRSSSISLPDPNTPKSERRGGYYGPPEHFAWFYLEDMQIYRSLTKMLAHFGMKFTTVVSDGSYFLLSTNPDLRKAYVVWRTKPQPMSTAIRDVYINGHQFSAQFVVKNWDDEDGNVHQALSYAAKLSKMP